MNGQPLTAAAHHVERAGYVMVFWAAVAWSTGGLFVRLIPLDFWALLGWRSLFGVAADLIFAPWHHPARAGVALRRRCGWRSSEPPHPGIAFTGGG
jgi:hypothetical protein